MLDIIATLYLLNTLVIFAAYAPQITKLIQVKEYPKNFSVASWTMWLWASAIALLYATLVLQDWEFKIVSTVGFLFNGVILILIIYKQRKYK